MKKIIIHHFFGECVCTTTDDVEKTLDLSIDGVNEFLIEFAETGTMSNCVEWDEL